MFPILAALGLASSVAADYYIDNANNTVAYAASGTGWQTYSFATRNLTFVFGDGMNVTVDSSKCYDQNYALAACTVANACQITFPFTGSGISVYVVQAGGQGVTASLTIDGGQSVTATLPPPNPPTYQTPNVSLFSIQMLKSADHTAAINLLDWENGSTSLYFDYAHINESHVEFPVSSSTPSSTPSSFLPSPTTSLPTTSSTATSLANNSTTSSTPPFSTIPFTTAISTTPSFTPSTHMSVATSAVSKPSPSVNVDVVAGSASGGVVVLIAIITAIILLKRRWSRRIELERSRQPVPFPAGSPASSRVPIVLSSTRPLMYEKTRVRPGAISATPSRPSRQSDGEPNAFHIPLGASSSGNSQGAEARPSTTDPFSNENLIIYSRPGREDGSFSNSHSSVAPDTPPPTGTAPPGYQSVEGAS